MIRLFTSTLGRKYIMAATGTLLFVFVLAHMIDNLHFFLGQEAINHFGDFLQSNLEIIWPLRLGILSVLVLHVWSAASLARENRAARPVPYAQWDPAKSSYASRTMVWSGPIVGAFVIYHLLHYTLQVKGVNLTGQDFHTYIDNKGRHDIFRMVATSFSQPVVALAYIVAMGTLCMHLYHGIAAGYQSVGWRNHTYRPVVEQASKLVAFLIFLGYISIPISVLVFGYGKEVVK
jgi:succinate dehydrogenase / fumarate reductase, cytochrome b subunit